MRQIFSIRFFAAVGAVAGLFLLLFTFFTARDAIDEAIDDGAEAAEPRLRGIDLVDVVTGITNAGFHVSADGTAVGDTRLVLDPSRQVAIVGGTPGEDHCGRIAEAGACAVVLDLLGEGVVWFALVPMGNARTVPMPAVETLEDGLATLVNGWQLPHAPAFDRRCPAPNGDGEEVFESYRQFKQLFGEDFTTLYDLDQRTLTAVVCRQRVVYAPPPRATSTTIPVATGSVATSVA